MSYELGGEACGVFAVHGHPQAAELSYFGLHALQHRGQESAGIVTSDGRKFNPVRGVLEGRRVCMVDDSIVRGTTSRKLVKMLYEAGATEVHVRISSPPITHPCFYGIDMPTRSELIGSQFDAEQIRQFLGATTLGYLSLEGMLSTHSRPGTSFCTACFSGHYPTPIEPLASKAVLETLGPARTASRP